MPGIVLERFRGDTYPVEATLSRDEAWTLDGSVVKMTFQFNDKIKHTFIGTVTDDINHIVEFEPTGDAVNKVRQGRFDIQVDDGFYIATHIAGEIHIVNDVTT